MVTENNRKNVLTKGDISRFQQFLWWVAGAEKSILIECKTDYQKYTAIGMVILMTTFVAFFAGGSAAWYFTQSSENGNGSWLAAIIFGIIWAILIFCIDRSLVVTIKKRDGKRNLWIPFLTRAALALLIAFMVSIPLELKIFEGFIKTNENDFINSINRNSYGRSLNKDFFDKISEIDSIARYDKNKASLQLEKGQQEQSSLENEHQTWILKKNNPSTNEINIAKNVYYEEQRNVASLRKQLDNTPIENIERWGELNDLIKKAEYKRNVSKTDLDNRIQKYRNYVEQEYIIPIGIRIDELKKDNEGYRATYEKNDSTITSNVPTVSELRSKILSAIEDTERKVKKSNKFIFGYQTLEYGAYLRQDGTVASLFDIFRGNNSPLENSATLFFLWLIRILFFLIEILPTVVKLAMPFGAYDRRVNQEEIDLELHLTSDEYIQHKLELYRIKQEAIQNETIAHIASEKALKEEIIQEMSDAQKEVAQQFTADWKDKQLRKLSRNKKIHIL